MPFMKESAPKVALCGLREIYSTWKLARDACTPHHMSWSPRWSSGSYFHKAPGDAKALEDQKHRSEAQALPRVLSFYCFFLHPQIGGMSPCLVFRWALGL